MSTTASPTRRRPGRLLVLGSALVATGGVLGLAGLAVATAAFMAATQRKFDRMGVQPGEFARAHIARATAATGAGFDAWRRSSDATSTRGGARRGPEAENARLGLREPVGL
jgi:hypothetical protein